VDRGYFFGCCVAPLAAHILKLGEMWQGLRFLRTLEKYFKEC
jgi:hypothetical protein